MKKLKKFLKAMFVSKYKLLQMIDELSEGINSLKEKKVGYPTGSDAYCMKDGKWVKLSDEIQKLNVEVKNKKLIIK